MRRLISVLSAVLVTAAALVLAPGSADASKPPSEVCTATEHKLAKHTRADENDTPKLWTPLSDVSWVTEIPAPNWQPHALGQWAQLPTGHTREVPVDCPPKDKKVRICHRNQGNPEWVVIEINENALDAHLNHQWGEDIYPVPADGCPTTPPPPPPPPANFIETSHELSCGAVDITLRNVSPWIYPVSVEIDGVHSYGPTVDNRTDGRLDGPQKDQSATRTITFAEDQNGGSINVRYRVQAGSENKLYKGLPVGEWTELVVDTDCIEPEPETKVETSDWVDGTYGCGDTTVTQTRTVTTTTYALDGGTWVPTVTTATETQTRALSAIEQYPCPVPPVTPPPTGGELPIPVVDFNFYCAPDGQVLVEVVVTGIYNDVSDHPDPWLVPSGTEVEVEVTYANGARKVSAEATASAEDCEQPVEPEVPEEPTETESPTPETPVETAPPVTIERDDPPATLPVTGGSLLIPGIGAAILAFGALFRWVGTRR